MRMDLRLSKRFGPVRQTGLIRPVKKDAVPAAKMHSLYVEDNLTEHEFQVMEFIGMTQVIKGGSILMSFQGVKRLLDLHQAKLTKAFKRLVEKELLEKDKAGYRLSDEGADLFNKLYEEYDMTEDRIPETLYTHRASGVINGYFNNHKEMREIIMKGLVGKWFGNYRFTAKVEYGDLSEICWVSTDGKTSISLLIGPENGVVIAHSSPNYHNAEGELEVLIDRISSAVEDLIDLPIEITSLVIFENDEIME